ncbi:MAG: 4-hydroxy-3-methylbut-2-enyl diphosphate reductase [Bacteroidetes bacterium]|nr:4-hydroxy-3-methylbut-2-enyl diphosphate reductase [Bacteroidota bacterium]
MQITIDNKSGFCFGVVNAIRISEEELAKDQLASLGDIVHNSKEVERLSNMGLQIISHEDMPNGLYKKVLIRAHGEPPSTYLTAAKLGIELIDATCPIVLKLQERIRKSYQEMLAVNGQVVIFGKEGHAEVIGLLGQTDGNAILIARADDIDKIDFRRPVRLYSQTTKDPNAYNAVSELIQERMHQMNGEAIDFKKYKTICGQMSGRAPRLSAFSKEHEVVIFVGGTKSSNAAALFAVCKVNNPNSYFVADVDGLNKEWFQGVKDVGISGATSTPTWLMEEVAKAIESITKEN